MKTYHVGGMNPVRRYKTLDAALAQATDDDTIELHKDVIFSGKITRNLILNGNGNTLTVENNRIGLECESLVVIQNLNIITNPRSNGIILRHGGRLENVKAVIKGPARVLYPTIIIKEGIVTLENCDIMRLSAEGPAIVKANGCIFRDYYGNIVHISGIGNTSLFDGSATLRNCTLNSCYFRGTATIENSIIQNFDRSCGCISMYNCLMAPTMNTASVNIAKEPADGPLEKANYDTHFSWEQEDETVTVYGYTSNIPDEFVGFHVLSGSLEMRNTNNADTNGYHVLWDGSLSFIDCVDAAFYEAHDVTLSIVRSQVNTSIKVKTAMEKLSDLIGLETVKTKLKSILNTVNRKQTNKNKNFGFSYHMVFAGDPGTGKTTVAKIVAQALFEIGAIPENKCTEVSADSLIKGYVGQTAEHVRKVLDSALGGVLFIDEAYELTVKDNQNSFNSDALSVLIRYMEENRDELVVIAAGYEKEMKEFLASNVGLTRRFQWIQFPDYTVDEMAAIFESMRESYEEEYEEANLSRLIGPLFEKLTSIYETKPDARGRITNGGNGGLVRNVFQQIVSARNDRVVEYPETSDMISKDDIKKGFQEEIKKALTI